ncbi:hypothetical protein M3221_07275 [Domibacillus indicus]|uniref:hypothetical protein n=1 Tax=Domibacillus indicus TaxID=1437523 RepID=UPI002041C415|nr:hypothetical protein [Domibacillus indicus]MCM3788201.1 hypothetical protein [Domibacillus indicus]
MLVFLFAAALFIHLFLYFLLAKKTGIEVENEMMAKYDLDVEVYKVSHHGSSTGTSASFLAAVDPSDAILSYGEGNT